MASDAKTTDPTLDPRGDHDNLRLRTPAELSAGLRALRDHLRGLDSASPEAALMNEAALYLDGATDSLREHMALVQKVHAERDAAMDALRGISRHFFSGHWTGDTRAALAAGEALHGEWSYHDSGIPADG